MVKYRGIAAPSPPAEGLIPYITQLSNSHWGEGCVATREGEQEVIATINSPV